MKKYAFLVVALFSLFLMGGVGNHYNWPANTIVVDPSGEEGVRTIAEAVARATAGTKIIVCPGSYSADKIVVDQTTLIITSGTDLYEAVTITGDDSLFLLQTDGLKISGVTLRATGTGDIVAIDTCNLKLKNCRVTGKQWTTGDGGVSVYDYCQFDITKILGFKVTGTAIASFCNWGYYRNTGNGTNYYGISLDSLDALLSMNYCTVYSDSETVVGNHGNLNLFSTTLYSVNGDTSVIFDNQAKLGMTFSRISNGYNADATSGATVSMHDSSDLNFRLSVIDSRNLSTGTPTLALKIASQGGEGDAAVLYTGIIHGDVWLDTCDVANSDDGVTYVHGVLATCATTVADTNDLFRFKQYNRTVNPMIGETIFSYMWTKPEPPAGGTTMLNAIALMDTQNTDQFPMVGLSYYGNILNSGGYPGIYIKDASNDYPGLDDFIFQDRDSLFVNTSQNTPEHIVTEAPAVP